MFADYIKNLRKSALLSQSEFAARIGRALCTVQRWEAGETYPNPWSMRMIQRFCERRGYDAEPMVLEWRDKH